VQLSANENAFKNYALFKRDVFVAVFVVVVVVVVVVVNGIFVNSF